MQKILTQPSKNQTKYQQTDDVAKNAHGIDYQVLVALWIALDNLSKGIKFELQMEAEGYGNFEDVVVFYKDASGKITNIDAIQNKHARDPREKINRKEFICNSNGSKELAIHKYFHRWVKDIRGKHKVKPIRYILWTNLPIADADFNACIQGEQFSPDFINDNLPKGSEQEKIRNELFFSIKKKHIYQKRKFIRTDDRGIFLGWQGSEQGKNQLIVEFLSSLYFRFGQLYYTNLHQAIKDLLDALIGADSEPIFYAFYMDFRAWLRERRGLSHSDESIHAFLQECKNKYILFREANGVSKHILDQKTGTIRGVHFQRKAEVYQLANFINSEQSILLLYGAAGSGRLSLIKRFFYYLKETQYLSQDDFLALDASKLNSEVIKLIHIPFLKFLIIYNVEYALQDTKNSQYLNYLANNASKNTKLILISLPESISSVNSVLNVSNNPALLKVSPLPLVEVVSKFPVLKKYEDLNSISKLLVNPVKLDLIITYWEQIDKEKFSELNEQNLTNYIIDTYVLNKIHSKQKRIILAKVINKSLKENTLTIEYLEDQAIIEALVSDNTLISMGEGKYLISHSMYIDWYIDQKLNERYENIEEEEENDETKALLELLEHRSFYHVKNWCRWHPDEFTKILSKLSKATLVSQSFDRLLTLIQSLLENNPIKPLASIATTWLMENWRNKTSQISFLDSQIQKLAEVLLVNVKFLEPTYFEELIDAALSEYEHNPCAQLLIDMSLANHYCGNIAEHHPTSMLKILENISIFKLPDYYPVSPFQGPYFDLLMKLGEKPEYLTRIIKLINHYIDELIEKNQLTPEIIQISFNKKKIPIKGTRDLWCLYRGYPHNEVPSALVVCLMGLELCLMNFFIKEINSISKRFMMNTVLPITIENSTNVCTLAIVAAFLSAHKEEFGHLGYSFVEIKQFLEWDHQRKLSEKNWAMLSAGIYVQQDLTLPEIDFHLKVKAEFDRFPYRKTELLDLVIYFVNLSNRDIKEIARKAINNIVDQHIISAVKGGSDIDISWLCILYDLNNIRKKGHNLFSNKLAQEIQKYSKQKEELELYLRKIREIFPKGVASDDDTDETITKNLCRIVSHLDTNNWIVKLSDLAFFLSFYYKLLIIYCYIDYIGNSLIESYLQSFISILQLPLEENNEHYRLQIEVTFKISEYLPLVLAKFFDKPPVLANSRELFLINNLIKEGIAHSFIQPSVKFRKIAADTAGYLWHHDVLFAHHCTLGLIKLATLEVQNKNKEPYIKELIDYFLTTEDDFEPEEKFEEEYKNALSDFINAVCHSDGDLTIAFQTLLCAFKLAFVNYNSEENKTLESSNNDDKMDFSTLLKEDIDTLERDSSTTISEYVLNEQQPLIYLRKHYFVLLSAQIEKTKPDDQIFFLLKNASLIMLKLAKHYSGRPEWIESVSSVFWQLWELFLLKSEEISVDVQHTILLSPNLMDLHNSLGYGPFVLKALEVYKKRNNLNKHVICSLIILSSMLSSEYLRQAYQFIEELLNNNINLDLDNDIAEFIKVFLIRINEDLTGCLLQDEGLQKVLYGRLERLANSGVFRADRLRQSLMNNARKHANTSITSTEEMLESATEADTLEETLNLYKMKGTKKPNISQSSNSFFSPAKDKTKKVNWQELPITNNVEFLVTKLNRNHKQVEILTKIIQDSLVNGALKNDSLTIESVMANLDLVVKDPLLYKQCKQLQDLHQEIQTFAFLIQEQTFDEKVKEEDPLIVNKTDISVIISGQQYVFTPKPTKGDGWCAFYAAGLQNPVTCIDTLLKQLHNKPLCEDLAYTILQNYISSLPIPGLLPQQQSQYVESFDIDKVYKIKIEKLFQKWDEADEKTRDADYKNLMQYLSQGVVIKAYLTSLKKSRYANVAIVKAYLKHILDTEMGVIVKYGSCYYADLPADNNEKTVYVLFDPSKRMSLAHYTKLELKNNNPTNAHILPLTISNV